MLKFKIPYELYVVAKECEATLINELSEYWEVGQMTTRWDVVNYCIGRFENVNETIITAISMLYDDNFITK